jgi:ABC-type iron transport system FetAB ATPase subunit
MDNLTLELKLTVTYIPNGVSKEELIKNLASLVSVGMGDGLLTGDTPAEVDTHYYEIKEGK